MNPAEQYILNQPEPYRSILMHLVAAVKATLPEAVLLYKYKIPYYYLKAKPFCYLNVSKNYVDLGFSNGVKITIHSNILVSENRTVVRSLRYRSLDDIDEVVLKEVLLNAAK